MGFFEERDRKLLVSKYADAYERAFLKARELTFHSMNWSMTDMVAISYLLAKCSDLCRLTAHSCQLLDMFSTFLAKALPRISKLVYLSLWEGAIGDASVRNLVQACSSCPSLRYLFLQRNNIACKGASRLADILPTSKISVVRLDQNHVEDAGASALSTIFAVSSHLKCIALFDNPISAEQSEALAIAWEDAGKTQSAIAALVPKEYDSATALHF